MALDKIFDEISIEIGGLDKKDYERQELYDYPLRQRIRIDKTKYRVEIPRDTETENSVDILITPRDLES